PASVEGSERSDDRSGCEHGRGFHSAERLPTPGHGKGAARTRAATSEDARTRTRLHHECGAGCSDGGVPRFRETWHSAHLESPSRAKPREVTTFPNDLRRRRLNVAGIFYCASRIAVRAVIETRVTNVGLTELRDIASLDVLILDGTSVTEEGLKELKDHK